MAAARAEVGVIGGSGLYTLMEGAVDVVMDTPYGPTSAPLSLGEIAGRGVAFIPRHGRGHEHPPQTVPYRANLWALRKLGVTRVIAPSASGSLQPGIRPGDIVICDQFVDRTSGRADTYSETGQVLHASMADPYCPVLRALGCEAARAHGIRAHDDGTVVVIQGPRFSSRAESQWFARAGWAVVNMTQYPEVALARELGLCYLNLSVVTDTDAGTPGDPTTPTVDARSVLDVLRDGMTGVRAMVETITESLESAEPCGCRALGESARI
ncbi:MAG: S-methyl-5'-thioadenosine phosphorylase [Candidatus Dormibacteria bacterium]